MDLLRFLPTCTRERLRHRWARPFLASFLAMKVVNVVVSLVKVWKGLLFGLVRKLFFEINRLFGVYRYHSSRPQEGGNQGVNYNIKTILSQLGTRQEEIDRLREKVETTKALQQEVQFLNAALQVS